MVRGDRACRGTVWRHGPGPFGALVLVRHLTPRSPYFVNDDLTLRENLGAWNRLYGTLFIEQPIGVGFSKKGEAGSQVDDGIAGRGTDAVGRRGRQAARFKCASGACETPPAALVSPH